MLLAHVKLVFAIADRQRLMVHLKDRDWDVRKFGPVCLRVGAIEIQMAYVGFSTFRGDLVLVLTPDDDHYRTVEAISGVVDSSRDVIVEVDPMH